VRRAPQDAINTSATPITGADFDSPAKCQALCQRYDRCGGFTHLRLAGAFMLQYVCLLKAPIACDRPYGFPTDALRGATAGPRHGCVVPDTRMGLSHPRSSDGRKRCTSLSSLIGGSVYEEAVGQTLQV
jgi:hypothetical protein